MLIDPCFIQELKKSSNIIIISIISCQVTTTGHKTINISPTVKIKYSPVNRQLILLNYLSGLKEDKELIEIAWYFIIVDRGFKAFISAKRTKKNGLLPTELRPFEVEEFQRFLKNFWCVTDRQTKNKFCWHHYKTSERTYSETNFLTLS